jgi:hypothetical protein
MMFDYEIGYGKPPKASQFRPGVSGYPQGRPKQQPSELNDEINGVLNSPVRHRESGHEKWTLGWQLNLKKLVLRAAQGDIDAAVGVLRYLKKAERTNSGKHRIVVEDWLSERPGQTGEQKTREFGRKGPADPVE